ncbi:Bifunctional DNA primase/polymerase, N-terminal [Parafrankia irregularis]|uniref:Bifunctional DNA primase/polymerase, N-terminal n=1 Tax=Parafrankia irregularis TaxID=795642 RepID=A0A0S4R067_9ACTN|nr:MULTISPECIES: bifunctional DNA primase/polymerase [Parafrankia]MBE3206642.1 bifunctional DNA primase/polymerase [Parafrankia sp. CH37]CUU60799.1 Bifunctional DNA primase/polymerase, N-terminal [Parafrankia irregularis]
MRIGSGVDAALAAAARGLALFPLAPGSRQPAPGWQRHCTTDPGQVAQLASAGTALGVGCRASDIVVLDLDRHPGEPDGIAGFAAACAAHGARWPDTFTVRTPRGGLHVYFAAAGRPIASTSGGRTLLGPGIDTRGPGRRSGGYLLAPGSRTTTGRYLIEHDRPITPLPAWLVRLLAVRPLPRSIGSVTAAPPKTSASDAGT